MAQRLAFGVFDHVDRRDVPVAQLYDEHLRFARLVDGLGFYGYHVAEHHFTPLGMAPSPAVYLGAVARETARVRIGPMVFLLPLYHPLRLIQEIAMLDHLSGGRLELGVGRGISPFEVGYFGIEHGHAFDLFKEAMAVVLAGLTSERLTHHGAHFRFSDVPMELRPLQQPYPPLWYGPRAPESRDYAAEMGMHAIGLGPSGRIKELRADYLERWERHAGSPLRRASPVQEPFIGALRQIYVGETDEEAGRTGLAAYRHWFRSLAKLWADHGTRPSAHMIEDAVEARDRGVFIVGSAARVRDELARQLDDSAMTYPMLQFFFGSMSHGQAEASLRRFAAEVAPAFPWALAP